MGKNQPYQPTTAQRLQAEVVHLKQVVQQLTQTAGSLYMAAMGQTPETATEITDPEGPVHAVWAERQRLIRACAASDALLVDALYLHANAANLDDPEGDWERWYERAHEVLTTPALAGQEITEAAGPQ